MGRVRGSAASPISVAALLCPVCESTIYSRCRHDYHSCPCGAVSIDGGFDYARIAWRSSLVPPGWVPRTFEMELEPSITKKMLYDDWDTRADKFGTIRGPNVLEKLGEAGDE